jgi:hypothetical protein
MNYIHQINAFYEKVHKDDRIRPTHITIYMALFQVWNETRFSDCIFINRNEIMQLSKIGSLNTYTKCMKELTEWGYLKYIPSYISYKGSQVVMKEFTPQANGRKYHSTGNNEASTPAEDSQYKSDKTGGEASEQEVRRYYINNNKPSKQKINTTNIKMGEEKNLHEPPKKNKEDNDSSSFNRKKESPKAVLFSDSEFADKERFKGGLAGSDFEAANLDYYHEIIKNWSLSKGAKKVDWMATAKNWMLRDYADGKLVKNQVMLEEEKKRERNAIYDFLMQDIQYGT